MSADLRFFKPAVVPPHDAVDLRFGETAAPEVVGTVSIALRVTLAATGRFIPRIEGTAAIAVSIAVAAVGEFRSLGFDLLRRRQRAMAAPWGGSVARERTITGRVDPPVPTDDATQGRWGQGAKRDAQHRHPWVRAARRDADRRAPWGHYERRVQPEQRQPWHGARKADDDLVAAWGRYDRALHFEQRQPWRGGRPADDGLLAPWGGPMARADPEQRLPWGRAIPRSLEQWLPWTRYSRQLAPTWGAVTPADPSAPGSGETVFIPVREVYMVINTVSLRRADTLAEVPCLSMTLTIDADSWSWGFAATVPGDALGIVAPVDGQPVELDAEVNGSVYRVLAERLARERVFGSSLLRISGRSRSAVLDAPYAPIRSFTNDAARTAQQLMADALTLNGASIGWGVDFELDDWLVPAGVFSQQGSYITALTAIAGAAGGYLQPHPFDSVVRVKPRYPVAPWDWGGVTPDVELPSDVTSREAIEWLDKPAYDRVFVSGTRSGILAQVTRSGFAGDLLAPLVTDPLITAAAAGRQRGLSILGDTGRQALVSLRTPVLEETGVIEPGRFVRYIDDGVARLGLVRSTAVEWSHPNVWQVIGVETHA